MIGMYYDLDAYLRGVKAGEQTGSWALRRAIQSGLLERFPAFWDGFVDGLNRKRTRLLEAKSERRGTKHESECIAEPAG